MKTRIARDYLIAVGAVAVTCAASYPVSDFIGYQSVGLLFLIVISLLSLFLGRSAVFFAALLASAAWNFFFIQPLFTLHINNAHDLIAVAANLMVALVGATLITRIRKNKKDLEESRSRLVMLNNFLESLNGATSIKDVVRRAGESFRDYFHADIVIFLREKNAAHLASRAFGNEPAFPANAYETALKVFKEPEKAVADWYPLREPRGVLGVLGICCRDQAKESGPDMKKLMDAFVVEVGLALEREISIDLAKEQELLATSEKLFQTILNSVSHEMRTPIAIMSSAISNLNDPKTSSRPELRRQLIGELENGVKRMNYIVANILDMSRIDSGNLRLNLQVCDITDVAGHVVHLMRTESPGHPLEITVSEDLPMVYADASLLTQALLNVVHNSLQYSSPGSKTRVLITPEGGSGIRITVEDSGPGVPDEVIPHLFEKFYRVPGSPSGGTGLGLTITRAIVEEHGGNVYAENTEGGGFRIGMIVPTDPTNGKK